MLKLTFAAKSKNIHVKIYTYGTYTYVEKSCKEFKKNFKVDRERRMSLIVADNGDRRANKHCDDDGRKGESGEPSEARGSAPKGVMVARVKVGGGWVERGDWKIEKGERKRRGGR